ITSADCFDLWDGRSAPPERWNVPTEQSGAGANRRANQKHTRLDEVGASPDPAILRRLGPLFLPVIGHYLHRSTRRRFEMHPSIGADCINPECSGHTLETVLLPERHRSCSTAWLR